MPVRERNNMGQTEEAAYHRKRLLFNQHCEDRIADENGIIRKREKGEKLPTIEKDGDEKDGDLVYYPEHWIIEQPFNNRGWDNNDTNDLENWLWDDKTEKYTNMVEVKWQKNEYKTFSRFCKLPPEIRRQIWKYALPGPRSEVLAKKFGHEGLAWLDDETIEALYYNIGTSPNAHHLKAKVDKYLEDAKELKAEYSEALLADLDYWGKVNFNIALFTIEFLNQSESMILQRKNVPHDNLFFTCKIPYPQDRVEFYDLGEDFPCTEDGKLYHQYQGVKELFESES
ncbi:hypothetical protein NHQ30_005166 [Ciborinia camelliae]|nr:hypothetical protein NHQ30_005166 [Ciborinia camelliae]